MKVECTHCWIPIHVPSSSSGPLKVVCTYCRAVAYFKNGLWRPEYEGDDISRKYVAQAEKEKRVKVPEKKEDFIEVPGPNESPKPPKRGRKSKKKEG